MAEKRRGADISHLHNAGKKTRVNLEDECRYLFRGVASAFSKQRGVGKFDEPKMFLIDFAAKVNTGCAMLLENLTKERKQMIECAVSEMRAMLNAFQLKHDNERKKSLKELMRKSKECKSSLKGECEKIAATCDQFCEELAAHLEAFKDIFSTFEVENKLMSKRLEQQSEKFETEISETGKKILAMITAMKDHMWKEQPGEESFQRILDYLRSFETEISETSKKILAIITAMKDHMWKEQPGEESFQRILDYLRSFVEDAAVDDSSEVFAEKETSDEEEEVAVEGEEVIKEAEDALV